MVVIFRIERFQNRIFREDVDQLAWIESDDFARAGGPY